MGIACNLLLCLGKGIVGALTGSVSITADALNNLSDASGSIVTLIGFRVADKPADLNILIIRSFFDDILQNGSVHAKLRATGQAQKYPHMLFHLSGNLCDTEEM